MNDGLLTARQAAAYVGLSPSGFYRRLRRLGITRRPGEEFRFTRAELDRFGVRLVQPAVSAFRAGEEWLRRA